MGMYTELVIKADIKHNLPKEVEKVLQYLFNNDAKPTKLPHHPFFECQRWDCIGKSSSHYHIPQTLNFYDGTYLFSRSDLKNYGGEIEDFVNWLSPYINCEKEKCIGWSWYEEDDSPTLLYKTS